MRRGSIRFRFMSAIMATTCVALLVSSVAMVAYNLRDYRERLTHETITQANIIGRAVTPALVFNDADSAQQYLDLFHDRPSILSAAIYTERGVMFAEYNREGKHTKNIVDMVESNSVHMEDNSLVIYRRIVSNNEIIGFVLVRMEYDFFPKLVGNVSISLVVTLLAMVIAFVVSLRLQKSITEPLQSLGDLSRQVVQTKNYALRAENTAEGEISILIDAYNDMLAEIELRQKLQESSNQELAEEIEERREAEQALKESEEKIQLLNAQLEKRVRDRTQQLEIANKELEAFSYSVSHDLRTPLRAIDGFSQAILEDYEDKLDEEGRDCLLRVRHAAQRMGALIDDMLKLSRVSRAEINIQSVDLSKLAEQLVEELKLTEPERELKLTITSGMQADCDPHLIKIALANLLGNAWKYSSGRALAQIEFGLRQIQGEPVFFVKDNGVGFDMTYAEKLFGAFQRLHTAAEFAGSGIGLATVKRVISRHGGLVWAESTPDKGAVFYFTLPPPEQELETEEEEQADDEQTADIVGGR